MAFIAALIILAVASYMLVEMPARRAIVSCVSAAIERVRASLTMRGGSMCPGSSENGAQAGDVWPTPAAQPLGFSRSHRAAAGPAGASLPLS